MKPLTNESYYTILENCTIEAFGCLDLKELYSNNGIKEVWDVSDFNIQSDRLPTEIIKESYIKENMSTTFLMALDMHWKQFEKKHGITRDYFYKKCFQSLLLKTSQSTTWNKPDFGFDINAEPCRLNFIWNMRFDIEARSIKHQFQPPEAVKPDEVKKEFKDFFNSDVNVNVIQSIQKEFKDYKGKKMAHLIYLLHKDFKIINYSLNSRNESRKHFVSLLKGTDFRMAGIDRYFDLSDVKLENPKFEIDPDYIDIKEKLLKTIK